MRLFTQTGAVLIYAYMQTTYCKQTCLVRDTYTTLQSIPTATDLVRPAHRQGVVVISLLWVMVRADFVHVQRDVIPMLVADRPWWRKHQQEQHPVQTNHLLPASRHISYCNLHFCKGRKGRFKECLIYINNVLVLFKLCCIWMCHITSPRVRHTVKYRTDTNLGCK